MSFLRGLSLPLVLELSVIFLFQLSLSIKHASESHSNIGNKSQLDTGRREPTAYAAQLTIEKLACCAQ